MIEHGAILATRGRDVREPMFWPAILGTGVLLCLVSVALTGC